MKPCAAQERLQGPCLHAEILQALSVCVSFYDRSPQCCCKVVVEEGCCFPLWQTAVGLYICVCLTTPTLGNASSYL